MEVSQRTGGQHAEDDCRKQVKGKHKKGHEILLLAVVACERDMAAPGTGYGDADQQNHSGWKDNGSQQQDHFHPVGRESGYPVNCSSLS